MVGPAQRRKPYRYQDLMTPDNNPKPLPQAGQYLKPVTSLRLNRRIPLLQAHYPASAVDAGTGGA